MRTFHMLNLNDCQVGLEDLCSKRHAALASTKVGKAQEDVLAAQKQEIDALPAALTGGRPLSDDLAATDDEHDGLGAAIWYATEAYLRAPNLDAKLTEAALRIRAAFIPQLAELNAAYADEAAAAVRRKDDPEALKADLMLFPIAGGGTLHDWTVAFVGKGQALSKLLSQRADINATTRKRAQALRSETIGILNDLRKAVAREQKRNPALPKDIDAQIFGYFDQLEEQRAAANRAAKAKANRAETMAGTGEGEGTG
jgi:hypothetical protein